jgi:HK97 family phage major capsid protein
MSEMVKALRERRQKVWEDMKALADKATDENRAFDAAEQGQWDAQNDELDKLDQRIKSALDTEQRAKDAEDAFTKLAGGERKAGGDDSEQRNQTNEELRKFLTGEGARVIEIKPNGPVNFPQFVVHEAFEMM